MLDLMMLAQECAPTVSPHTMAAVVSVESRQNPFAIGVVGGRLARQPASKAEAVATAHALAAGGWNFSLGIAQVNQANLPAYKLTYEQAFDACENMRVGSKILEDCYVRALKRTPDQPQTALQASFSCYYSGNFTRGFKPDKLGHPSYVQKIMAAAAAIPVVPNVAGQRPQFDKAAIAADAKAAAPSADAAAVETVAPVAKAAPFVPADHAPVVLPSSREREEMRIRALVTEAATRSATPVTTGVAPEALPPAKPQAPTLPEKSTVVF